MSCPPNIAHNLLLHFIGPFIIKLWKVLNNPQRKKRIHHLSKGVSVAFSATVFVGNLYSEYCAVSLRGLLGFSMGPFSCFSIFPLH